MASEVKKKDDALSAKGFGERNLFEQQRQTKKTKHSFGLSILGRSSPIEKGILKLKSNLYPNEHE